MGITLTSEITVRLVQQCGGDHMTIAAAKVSTSGEEALKWAGPVDGQAKTGLINYLVKSRHGTTTEHGLMTFFVHAPAFVWWEWIRHRVGMTVDCPELCLAGDTEICLQRQRPGCSPEISRRAISSLYQNWHVGVADRRPTTRARQGVRQLGDSEWLASIRKDGKKVRLGTFATEAEAFAARAATITEDNSWRTRLLPQCRKLSARVLNEDTGFFEAGPIRDVFQRGVQEIVALKTAKGHLLKCTRNHRVLTQEGWRRAGDLSRGDRMAVAGRRALNPERAIPLRLRQGIGLWATAQRDRLIGETDRCYVCHSQHARRELILDHVVPVAADLSRALDVANLKPICRPCHRTKTNGEQKLARRGHAPAVVYVPLMSDPTACAEEMTYDIEMGGRWHNFLADNWVVHNSFNLESGRYKVLDPVFWIPRPDRKMTPARDHKPARPKFEAVGPSLYARSIERKRVAYQAAWECYQDDIDEGIANEVARPVLGFGIYYSGWVTTNPRALMNFLSLRTHEPDAKFPSFPLAEIEEAARAAERIFATYWPVTHQSFCDNGRVGP